MTKNFAVKIGGKVFILPVNVGGPAPAPDTTPPAAPVGLAGDGSDGLGGIQLTWTPNTEPDLLGYNIYRRAGSAPFGLVNNGGLRTDIPQLDTTADIGIPFDYQVTAVDKSGNESIPSSTIMVTRAGAPPDSPPAVPSTLTATGSLTGIALNWADNTEPDLDFYRIYRASAVGGPFTLLNTSVASAYNDITAPENVPTFYRVTAVDVAGNESMPAAVSATRPLTPQGTPVPIAAKGTMSPCTVHCYATPHGGHRYTQPAVGTRAGLPIPTGTPLTTRYQWEALEPDGATLNGLYPTAEGFNFSHQFVNNTGSTKTFKVRLTMTFENGTSAVYTSSIPVLPDTRTPIYVDVEAGNDANSGLAVGLPKKTVAAGYALLTTPDRKLLLAETTAASNLYYPAFASLTLNKRNTLVDSYIPAGRLLTEKPRIAWAGNSGNIFNIAASDVTVQNLRLDWLSPIVQTDAGPTAFKTGNVSNATIRACTLLHGSSLIVQDIAPSIPPDGVLIQDCSASGINAYGGFCIGSNWCFFGNSFQDPREHCVRFSGVDNFNVQHNDLYRGQPAGEIQRGTITIHVGAYGYISQNTTNGGDISTGPLGVGSNDLANKADRAQFVVIERNNISAIHAVNSGHFGSIVIGDGSENVIIRNNIITNWDYRSIELRGFNAAYSRGVNAIDIYNNTMIAMSVSGKSLKIASSATAVRARNNVYLAGQLTTQGSAQEIADFNCFSTFLPAGDTLKAVDRNIWPTVLHVTNPTGTTPNVFSVGGVKITLAQWNADAHVGDDAQFDMLFGTQSGGVNYRARAGTIPATFGRPTPGVSNFPDFYGVVRSRTAATISVGAAEA